LALKFKLTGKTNKGKNRIHENGDTWMLVKGESRLSPAQILIESVKTGYMCWVQEKDDENFEIEKL
jgi:hypothetical protein